MKRGNPSLKTKPLSEAHIEATCTNFLELDGWRAIETDPKHLRGLGVSEPGMPDKQYIRYYKGLMPGWPFQQLWAEVMWIEWKRIRLAETKRAGFTGFHEVTTKKAKHQLEWHERERARGALTLIAGEDFPASIEGFCTWYAQSGLQRKSISIPR